MCDLALSDFEKKVLEKASSDEDFRQRLLIDPAKVIEHELGIRLPQGIRLRVHQDTYTDLHLVLPPTNKFSEAEIEEAKQGMHSLEFLKKTLYDPAPPARTYEANRSTLCKLAEASVDQLLTLIDASIQRGLAYLDSNIEKNGAWRCIRFNIADPNIPRHYERPPFVSALCTLALSNVDRPLAQKLVKLTEQYLIETMEYPGLWRYYRHLPLDLDSSTLCSIALRGHPWMLQQRNVPSLLSNLNSEGLFLTWITDEDEPEVVEPFRIEADPVVNANVLCYLGDCDYTTAIQPWLVELLEKEEIAGSSKWYPREVAFYYALARAMQFNSLHSDRLVSLATQRLLKLQNREGSYGNVLETSQAISALYDFNQLQQIDLTHQLDLLLSTQDADGSWPELLAFGDEALRFGLVGQFGHGSEQITTAFCLEALEKSTRHLTQLAT